MTNLAGKTNKKGKKCFWGAEFESKVKKHVNRDSHIASSLVSQNYFFEEIYIRGFLAVSTRLWPALLLLFFFFQVCYGWPQKNDFHQFSHFFKFSGSNGRNHRGIWDVVDSFETYKINSLMKKKLRIWALFWVAQSKWQKVKIIFLPTSLKCHKEWPHSLGANFFSMFYQNFFFTNWLKRVILRTRHCTHMNTSFLTEIGRKVSYAVRKETRKVSDFHRV